MGEGGEAGSFHCSGVPLRLPAIPGCCCACPCTASPPHPPSTNLPAMHRRHCCPPTSTQGHIALDSAVWPEGTPGCAIDVLARLPLWGMGLNYRHGTGHGVGAALNVHEGPQSISSRWVDGWAVGAWTDGWVGGWVGGGMQCAVRCWVRRASGRGKGRLPCVAAPGRRG